MRATQAMRENDYATGHHKKSWMFWCGSGLKRSIPVSGPILQEKALSFAKNLGIKEDEF